MTKESKHAKIEAEGQDWCFPELGITVKAKSYHEALEKLKKLQDKGKK